MNIILENIRKVLLEGRIEDVKKKFPNVSPKIIDYFVENDPSGNQKYLEWLVKAMTHEPTIQSVEDTLDDSMLFKLPQEFLMMLVKKFHELSPYMVYAEDGKRVGTTDLYQYKFIDSDMIHYLNNDLTLAKERKKGKEKQKDAKKNSDKIYEDGSWLVIRPKTWQASCVYGAGTKWCTTNKESSRHFEREIDRNFLIYVIDKTKSFDNDLYKVAWQIPYTKNVVKKYTIKYEQPDSETDSFEFDLGSGIKLWDAKDDNMARKIMGISYVESVPLSVKQAILNYMDFKMGEMYLNMAYVEDPYLQALIENLGLNEEQSEDIDEQIYRHYSMRVFEYDGENYAVGSVDDVEVAKLDWARSLIDDLGVTEVILDFEKYVTISNVEVIANDMTDSYIEDLSDEDVIEEAERLSKRSRKIKEILEEYNINQSIMETNQEEIDGMWKRYDDLTEEEENYLKEFEDENDGIAKHNSNLFDKIRDTVRDDYYDGYVTRLNDDPIDWLWEMGYYSKKTGLEKVAIQNGIVDFDEELAAIDLADDAELNTFGNYNDLSINGTTYFVFSAF